MTTYAVDILTNGYDMMRKMVDKQVDIVSTCGYIAVRVGVYKRG